MPKGLEYYLGLIETMDDFGDLEGIEEEDEGGDPRNVSGVFTDYQYRHSLHKTISQYWYRIYGAEDLF